MKQYQETFCATESQAKNEFIRMLNLEGSEECNIKPVAGGFMVSCIA